MKIPIIDLMDYYFDDTVKLDTPEIPSSQRGSVPISPAQKLPLPLLIAATLLLVMTGIFALGLGYHPAADTGTALQDSPTPLETFSPEAPTVEPDASSPEVRSTTESEASGISPQLLTVTDLDWDCCGNLFYADDTYYTMTTDGPEAIEMQNVTTTVSRYGTWEVDFDYAIVDGELVLHNNTSTEYYTVIDGETVRWSEYYGDMSPQEIHATPQLTWLEPSVAVASTVEGYTDLVSLQIQRTDLSPEDRATYPLLYNLTTGALSDPLANVSALYDHGSFSYATFNRTLTRAIVDVTNTAGRMDTYLCDLTTGEMIALADLAAPYIPESEYPETTYTLVQDNCAWADADTLLFWIQESVPNGQEEGWTEDMEYLSPLDDIFWLCAYDFETETLRYSLRDVDLLSGGADSSLPYLHSLPDDCFQVVDTATGIRYTLEQPFDSYTWAETTDRFVIYEAELALYLVDDTQMAWVNLAAYLSQMPEDVEFVRMLTDDWLCLQTSDTLYFYHIPEVLAWTPLTEN